MPFRSESHNATPANPQTITAPAGIQNGDLLVAYVVADASTATDPPLFPAGFSEITGSPLTSTADGQRLYVATKKANNEVGNYTLGAAAGDGLSTIGGILCFSNIASVSFVHRVATGSSSTANASPWTITSGSYVGGNTAALCDLLWISASDENGVPPTSTSTPTGFTSRADFNDGGFLNLQAFTKDSIAAGDTGVYTSTVTDVGHTGGWGVFVLALLQFTNVQSPIVSVMPAVRGVKPVTAMIMRQLRNATIPAPVVSSTLPPLRTLMGVGI